MHRRTHLVGEFADAGAQHGVDLEAGDVLGVLGDDVAELEPELVLAFALQRAECVIVHQLRHLARSLAPQTLRKGKLQSEETPSIQTALGRYDRNSPAQCLPQRAITLVQLQQVRRSRQAITMNMVSSIQYDGCSTRHCNEVNSWQGKQLGARLAEVQNEALYCTMQNLFLCNTGSSNLDIDSHGPLPLPPPLTPGPRVMIH